MIIDEGKDERVVRSDPVHEPGPGVVSRATFEHLAAELATTFVDISAEAVDDHIEAALGRVATALPKYPAQLRQGDLDIWR